MLAITPLSHQALARFDQSRGMLTMPQKAVCALEPDRIQEIERFASVFAVRYGFNELLADMDEQRIQFVIREFAKLVWFEVRYHHGLPGLSGQTHF